MLFLMFKLYFTLIPTSSFANSKQKKASPRKSYLELKDERALLEKCKVWVSPYFPSGHAWFIFSNLFSDVV